MLNNRFFTWGDDSSWNFSSQIFIADYYSWDFINVVDMNVNDLTANVQSPNGRIEEAQIIETEDNNYSIRFIPKVWFNLKIFELRCQ